MKLKDRINSLKMELDKLRPITPDAERRIMEKFKLDWNFYSSDRDDDNSSYGETRAIILYGITSSLKPLKEAIDSSGHDAAILLIEEIIKLERPLTESFIRELHKIILKKPYQVVAKTPDGKPTMKWVRIGEYKNVPNHVETVTGEIFRFAEPEETAAKMEELMIWYKDNVDNVELHPLLFATEFHYRFVRIHPFDDGNGRISRMLMNFILMQKGFPPAIIKREEKDEYKAALRSADAGNLIPFADYIGDKVIRSLEIMIKGAQGEDISEEDDLDKEILLLKKKIDSSEDALHYKKSESSIAMFYELFYKQSLEILNDKLQKFDKLFLDKNYLICTEEFQSGKCKTLYEALNMTEWMRPLMFNQLVLTITWLEFRKASNPFGIEVSYYIITSDYYFDIYTIVGNDNTTLYPENKEVEDHPEEFDVNNGFRFYYRDSYDLNRISEVSGRLAESILKFIKMKDTI